MLFDCNYLIVRYKANANALNETIEFVLSTKLFDKMLFQLIHRMSLKGSQK